MARRLQNIAQFETSNESCDTNVKIEKTKDQKEIQTLYMCMRLGRIESIAQIYKYFMMHAASNTCLYSHTLWSTYSKSL